MDTVEQAFIDEETGNITFEILPYWTVYFLMNDDKIVYIGCTSNIKQRVAAHRSGSKRKFDSYVIYFETHQKFEAECMEKRMIAFVSDFTDYTLQNINLHNHWKKKKVKYPQMKK